MNEMQQIDALRAQVEALTRAVTARPAHRRGTWFGITGLTLGLALGWLSQPLVQAQEPAHPRTDVFAPIAEHLKPIEHDLSGLVAKVRTQMHTAEQFNPEHAIAVFLYDLKEALAAMPGMAADMHEMNGKMTAVPFMATQMQLMNAQMGVMATGVDSTLGRMGRGMPWMPWMP